VQYLLEWAEDNFNKTNNIVVVENKYSFVNGIGMYCREEIKTKVTEKFQ
jgi:hypothetical protein